MDFLVNLANGLTGIVSAGADNLVHAKLLI